MSSPDSLGDPPSFSSESLGFETPKLFNCKLTTDKRYLAFNRLDENEHSEDESLEPLEVGKILTMEPVIGKKKHALKKYNQFTLNTGCTGSSITQYNAISRNFC